MIFESRKKTNKVYGWTQTTTDWSYSEIT